MTAEVSVSAATVWKIGVNAKGRYRAIVIREIVTEFMLISVLGDKGSVKGSSVFLCGCGIHFILALLGDFS